MNTEQSTARANPTPTPLTAAGASTPPAAAPFPSALSGVAPASPGVLLIPPSPAARSLPVPVRPGPAKPPPIHVDAAIGTISVLSEADQLRLMALEDSIGQSIEQGWRSFVDTGLALIEIRNDHLYAAEFPTFEDYCRVKWDFKHSKANYLMAAAQVVKSLAVLPNVPTPERESPLRPLLKLKPEDAQRAWQRAVEKTGGRRITARIVKHAVQELNLAAESPKGRSARSQRIDQQRLIADCFGDLMKLLSQRSNYPSVLEKVQELHGLVEGLFAKRKA